MPSSIVRLDASKRHPARRVGSADRLTPQKLSDTDGLDTGIQAARPESARNEPVLEAPVDGKSPDTVRYARPEPIAQLADSVAAEAVPVTTPVARFTAVIVTVSADGAPPSVAEATRSIPTSNATICCALVRGSTTPPGATPPVCEDAADEIPRVAVPDPNNSKAMLFVKLRNPTAVIAKAFYPLLLDLSSDSFDLGQRTFSTSWVVDHSWHYFSLTYQVVSFKCYALHCLSSLQSEISTVLAFQPSPFLIDSHKQLTLLGGRFYRPFGVLQRLQMP